MIPETFSTTFIFLDWLFLCPLLLHYETLSLVRTDKINKCLSSMKN